MSDEVVNLSVYVFEPVRHVGALAERFEQVCAENDLRGTVIVAPEGVNCAVAGGRVGVEALKVFLAGLFPARELDYKESGSARVPFGRMLVKQKDELIPLGPYERTAPPERVTPAGHLEPARLREWLDAGKRVRLLDTRNEYEVRYGTFHGAKHLGIRHFREFPKRVGELPPEWKDEPVVMFCTGGIRCDKASRVLSEQGFREVYQIRGGILKYLEECGGNHYEGDCYVFDERVALTPELAPAGVGQCRGCSVPVARGETRCAQCQLPES